MSDVAATSLLEDVTRFIYDEAQLLDAGKFREWFSLFDEDGYYWMPVSPADTERLTSPAIFDADKAFLEIIINRLYLNNAYSFIPQHRFCRIVSNVCLLGTENGAISVRSKLAYHEYRTLETADDDHRILAGTVHHLLVPKDGSFLIKAKRVDLIQSEAALSAVSAPI
jgi:3-phenylpropionate/cinnamic acid dioxygenase small subunit